MITVSKNLMFDGSHSSNPEMETPIHLNISHYAGKSSYSMGLWLTVTQAQDLAAHLSALVRNPEKQNAV
jgi:hypothetical protein